MSNLNLFGKEWTNIVFENRNKLYGAYKLRQESHKTTFIALAIGLTIISLGFGSSYLYASNKNENTVFTPADDSSEKVTLVETDLDKIVEPPVTEKPAGTKDEPTKAVETKTDVMDNKKLTDVNIVEDHKVKNDDLTAQDEFDDNTNSSTDNVDANKNGSLNTDGTKPGDKNTKPGKDKIGDGSTSGSTALKGNEIVTLVQKKAVPVEGYQKFFDAFVRKFSKNTTETSLKEVTIKLRFVVEKDGSFTDIQIVEDKLGMGQEAIRVLQTMPKWKPAEHNGKTVRSKFTLPIKIKINN
ncbi:energy transducer TonB [Paenimyroides aestuarii]|uniref:Energy transducer TonB n=1 Tax=Paenimyroides aestuarii TaxID=2968490 RepID=A0ABY5NT93_9FLAO|nr:energy transducer TonB [Paenimyroides aestuarii]UUV21692.1 energy transducer TonB [Paenimyroides aestuarii]